MGDAQPPYTLPPPYQPPPAPSLSKSNMPMLYYGLVVVGTAAIVLALYNLIIIKWCTNIQRSDRRGANPSRLVEVTAVSQSFENPNRNLLSSFNYKRDAVGAQEEGGNEYECAVCLSTFEDGEEVRQLPFCKHSFHVSCIDMWLYSHSDCPLCRSPVNAIAAVLRSQLLPAVNSPQNPREGLLEAGISV